MCSDAGLVVHGFDAGIAVDGWGLATASQPNGAGKLPLVVTRKSTDGRLQLKQTFTRDGGQRELSVKMDLKNLSATAAGSVLIARYFDGDIDFSSNDDIYELTLESVVGRNSSIDNIQDNGHGLVLSGFPLQSGDPRLMVESVNDWSPNTGGAETCRTCFAREPGQPSPTPSDQVGRIVVQAGGLQPGQTTSVTFVHRVSSRRRGAIGLSRDEPSAKGASKGADEWTGRHWVHR